MKKRIKDGLKLEYAVLWRIIFILKVYCSVQVYMPFTDIVYREKSLMSPLMLHSFVNELDILISSLLHTY